MLTVIIPAYNEEQMIPKTARVISELLENEKIPNEILFVDDGSKDKTWLEILKAGESYPNVGGISFSRNFGKEAAMMAGLKAAGGNCAVIIDCDLQHPPVKIVDMYRLWEQGYEVVEGVKASRGKESGLHGFAAGTFYKIISKAVGIDMENASDFKLMDRKVIDILVSMPERNAFFRALSSWVGFKTAQVEFDVQEREAGSTKWNTFKLTKYALTNIASFTSFPMQMVTVLGAMVFGFTVIAGIVLAVKAAAGAYIDLAAVAMLLIGLSSGIMMTGMGIMGYYIAKIYEEVKARPRYIVSHTARDGQLENQEKSNPAGQ